MSTTPEPVRKSLLPCTPPPEWEFSTVVGQPEGCLLADGSLSDDLPVVRRLRTYGDWEPVQPDRWADEPRTGAIRAASGVQPDAGFVPRACIACGHASHAEVCDCGCKATVITDWGTRSVPDTERRARYGKVLRKWGLLDEVNNPDDAEHFAVSDLLAVRDRLVEQLTAGRATWKAKAEEIEADRDRLRDELAAARATVLREQADFYDGVLRDWPNPDSDPRYCTAIHDVILGLRRLADETAAGSGGQAEDGAQPTPTVGPTNFAEAMANPTDRAILADSLDIALGGGCGRCDTEADHMCVGCQRCRCFDHDTCTRPAS